LVKFGRNKTFRIYADVDNVLNIETLIAEKLKFLTNLKFDADEFRKQLKSICVNEKGIDIDKLSDEQVKALNLLCIYDKDTEIDDKDVAVFLNIPLATIKVWQTDMHFRKVKNALNEFNIQSAKGDILQLAWREAQRRPDGNSLKNLMNYLGMTKEMPIVTNEFNIVSKERDENKEYIDSLINEVYQNKK
jgi:hypothetical protein